MEIFHDFGWFFATRIRLTKIKRIQTDPDPKHWYYYSSLSLNYPSLPLFSAVSFSSHLSLSLIIRLFLLFFLYSLSLSRLSFSHPFSLMYLSHLSLSLNVCLFFLISASFALSFVYLALFYHLSLSLSSTFFSYNPSFPRIICLFLYDLSPFLSIRPV